MHTRYNIVGTIITFCVILLLPVQWQSDFFYNIWDPTATSNPSTNLAWEAATIASDADGIFVRLIKIFGLDTFINSDQSAVSYIQYIINMLLWLAAFIALIILLYWFYLMFFSTQEEWFDKAKKIIIWVTTALFIMWLAWIIIRFLFFLYSLIQ